MKRALLLLLLTGCLDVADLRALRDLEVGRASSAAVTVEIVEGHGAVRRIEGTDVAVWANAPTLEIVLQPTSTEPVTLTIENILADATLEGDVPITETNRRGPTEVTWTIAAAGRTVVRLTTADRDDLTPWRFAVFADVQDAIDEVQDIYTLLDQQGARFALIAGDLTERGTEEQLQEFQAEMKSLAIPAFATLGNHELGDDDELFHDYFGRGTSSFTFRGVRFTFVDSASATIAPLTEDMLVPWLDRPEDLLHVATMHIPPHDPIGIRNGAFASRAEASRLLQRLADGGVDTTFYGHVHSYYAFDNAGMPAFITGGGGAIPERMDGIGRHFLTVDAMPRARRLRTGLVRVDP